jgi:hypothetical protein
MAGKPYGVECRDGWRRADVEGAKTDLGTQFYHAPKVRSTAIGVTVGLGQRASLASVEFDGG